MYHFKEEEKIADYTDIWWDDDALNEGETNDEPDHWAVYYVQWEPHPYNPCLGHWTRDEDRGDCGQIAVFETEEEAKRLADSMNAEWVNEQR